MAAPDFESLPELVRATDVAVVGRITAVERGREWLSDPTIKDPVMAELAMARFATITIEVESVVAGEDPGAGVAMEAYLSYPEALHELQDTRPLGRALFFLHEKVEPGLDGIYRLVADSGAYYLDVDGTATPPELDGSILAGKLSGQSFVDVVEQIKALAVSGASP
jgi:hypothetical protein